MADGARPPAAAPLARYPCSPKRGLSCQRLSVAKIENSAAARRPLPRAALKGDGDRPLFGSFRPAGHQRQATVRTSTFRLGPFAAYLADRHVARVPALGTGTTPLLAAWS